MFTKDEMNTILLLANMCIDVNKDEEEAMKDLTFRSNKYLQSLQKSIQQELANHKEMVDIYKLAFNNEIVSHIQQDKLQELLGWHVSYNYI